MDINAAFPSKYLKAADLQGRQVTVAISNCVVENVGTDSQPQKKPVLYFSGASKGFILNRTNGEVIVQAYGTETDNWLGAKITLFAAPVAFKGKMVPGLHVAIPAPPRTVPVPAVAPVPAPAPVPTSPAGAPADPFGPAPLGGGGETAPAFGDDGLNDEIPFGSPWGDR